MSRDRLAQMRAQQGNQAASYYNDNSYSNPPTPRRGQTRYNDNADAYQSGYSNNLPPPRSGRPGPGSRQPRPDDYAENDQSEYYQDPPPPRAARPGPGPRAPRPPPVKAPFDSAREDSSMEMRQVRPAAYPERTLPAGPRGGGPYQPDNGNAMSQQAPPAQGGPRAVGSTQDFFDGIDVLKNDLARLNDLINKMQRLQQQSLGPNMNDPLTQQIEQTAVDVKMLTQSMTERIQGYERDHSLLKQRMDPTGDLNVRSQQLDTVKKSLRDAIQRSAEVQRNQRQAIRSKTMRQAQVIYPDATPQEIEGLVEDQLNGANPMFAQGLQSSQRVGAARNALKEVQSRAAQMKWFDAQIQELLEMFEQLASICTEQDVPLQHIEKTVDVAVRDVGTAVVQLNTAKESAKSARKSRKCCFIVIVIILLAIAGVVAFMILTKTGIGGGAKSSSAAAPASSSSAR